MAKRCGVCVIKLVLGNHDNILQFSGKNIMLYSWCSWVHNYKIDV